MPYNQGVILTKIQRLLGHKSVLTTERYLGVKFKEIREAILKLERALIRILRLTINGTSVGDEKVPKAGSSPFLLN